MEKLNDTWEQIKNYWRNKFHQREVFKDENEHIIVFKSMDIYIILGYLHFQSTIGISASYHIDFINFIKKLGTKSYNPFKIYLLCNHNLSKIDTPSDILTLPDDVEYYFVDYNSFYETINFELENKIKSAKHSQYLIEFNKPWYHKKNIQVINDSRFEDWDKWAIKEYNREWYEYSDIEKFEADWEISSIISVSEIYIDDRFIFGFFVVWKNNRLS